MRIYQRRGGDKGPVEVMESSEPVQKHEYHVARNLDSTIAVAFPLNSHLDAAQISTTLPLCGLPGLKTPLDAPFELTANREALLDVLVKRSRWRACWD